jgi:hypothetical protein
MVNSRAPTELADASQRSYLTARAGFGHDRGWPAAQVREPAPFARRAGAGRMRILIRLLSCVVIVSAAITVWTRAALVFALGPRLASACLWIAAGGSLCAVITLACTRKRNRQQHRPLEPPAGPAVRGDSDRAGLRS